MGSVEAAVKGRAFHSTVGESYTPDVHFHFSPSGEMPGRRKDGKGAAY